MNSANFEKFLDVRLGLIKQTLGSKAKEYATSDNRFHNFIAGMPYLELDDPAGVCWAYMTKHMVSIQDIVFGRLQATPEQIVEKLGDAINYLILLEGMLLYEQPQS